jgi:hypothetical protein
LKFHYSNFQGNFISQNQLEPSSRLFFIIRSIRQEDAPSHPINASNTTNADRALPFNDLDFPRASGVLSLLLGIFRITVAPSHTCGGLLLQ